MKTGIYTIHCMRNGRNYVGQTDRSFSVREAEHWEDLRAGTHPNNRLQADWNRYGERAFRFSVVERADKNLNTLETVWILRLRAEYNICWPGMQTLIRRDKSGNIIPLKKKPVAADWSWWWASMVGAIAGVIWLAA